LARAHQAREKATQQNATMAAEKKHKAVLLAEQRQVRILLLRAP
jgi:hypothetical protein